VKAYQSALADVVDQVLANHGSRPGSLALNLAWAVDGWIHFSHRVAVGNSGGIDDYLIELHRRDLLDEVVALAPEGPNRSELQE
jgi:hypothetical protein